VQVLSRVAEPELHIAEAESHEPFESALEG
jgi:hypothetical protein